MSLITSQEWDSFLEQHLGAHILQSSTWGIFKSEFGWEIERVIAGQVGAQVLFRTSAIGLRLAYIPKGPVSSVSSQISNMSNHHANICKSDYMDLWRQIDNLCKKRGVIFLKIEPDIWEDEEARIPSFQSDMFQRSPHSIQPQRTLIVNINDSEDEILSRMKQKTRYNIRLALKKGVKVRISNNINHFYRLMDITSKREEFGVHSLDYYRRAYTLFNPRDECEVLIAEFNNIFLAAVMVFACGLRSWYFYGASSNEKRELMAPYLLHWEAMRWARSMGCVKYDLWGVPDVGEEILERDFTRRSDGLWGVYRFKRGFGGEVRRASGPWDRVYNPFLYRLYNWLVKRKTLSGV